MDVGIMSKRGPPGIESWQTYINVTYKLLHGEANDKLSGPYDSTRKHAEGMGEIWLNNYQLLLDKVRLQLLLHKTFLFENKSFKI